MVENGYKQNFSKYMQRIHHRPPFFKYLADYAEVCGFADDTNSLIDLNKDLESLVKK